MFAGVARGVPSFGDLAWHAPVTAIAYGALSASTLAPVAGISVGQTLTKTTNGAIGSEANLRSTAAIVVGDRVLVTSEASPKNGIYTVTALGSAGAPWRLTRALDADTASELPFGSSCFDLFGNGLWLGISSPASGAWTLAPNTLGAVTLGLSSDARVRRSAAKTVQFDDTLGGPLTLLDLLGAPIAGKAPVVQVYGAGTTWVPPAGLLYAIVECQGGGGAGGGAPLTAAGQSSGGGGGAGGGYARKLILASALSGNYTVVVGAGGTGVSGASGNTGGLSSFAGAGIVTIQGNGGGPGTASAAAATLGEHPAGGVGGTASGGDLNVKGSAGAGGQRITATLVHTGAGGSSQLGGGARGQTAATAAGEAGGAYGGGGGGASAGAAAAAQTGGAGADGVVTVTEYYGP